MLSGQEIKNLKKLQRFYNFESLRPSLDEKTLEHPVNDIFVPLKDTNNVKKRNIFYKVNYEQEEEDAINQTKQQMEKQNIRHEYVQNQLRVRDQIILKHIYAADFDIQKAIERLKQLIQFHNNPVITRFDETTIQSLKSGKIYTYGCDKQYRPIVVMRIDKFDMNLDFDEHFNTMYYVLLVVLGYKMVPYSAEKNVLIIDLSHLGYFDIPFKYLYNALEKLQLYYCANMQGIFVYNWQGISVLWKMVSKFLTETQKKRIVFIEKGQQHKILEKVDEYELEQRYGGKLADLTEYWPPQDTHQTYEFKLNKNKSQNTREQVNETLYESAINDNSYFDDDDETACGKNCSCDIY